MNNKELKGVSPCIAEHFSLEQCCPYYDIIEFAISWPISV